MFISESFLSFIWQFQYFDRIALADPNDNQVMIVSPGNRNLNQGPDFLNSTIKIGDVTWHGNVEIHVKASDWVAHRHDKNPGYDNVILHVVWENDIPVLRSDRTLIPAIELKNRVHNGILYKFHQLVNNPSNTIPCSAEVYEVDFIHKSSMLESVMIERIKMKSEYVLKILEICGQDWEETTYRILFMNFGFKINQHPMMALATYLPFRLIKKHSDNLCQLEALLFGTAGFLENKKKDGYHQKLSGEYDFLKKKYGLQNEILTRYQWKFMRTHPSNFPTLRLAELALFLHKKPSLFGMIRNSDNIREVTGSFKSRPTEYWNEHYDFGKKWNKKSSLGSGSIHGLIINTFVPVLGAYGIFTGEESYIQKAVNLLSQLPPEDNKVVRTMKDLGFNNITAADSQGLLQLHNCYCIKRRCLECRIGIKLLQSGNLPGQ